MSNLGPQFHPNVDHYQSGGIGHQPDDPTRSVVGMVPTHVMKQYAEHHGDWDPTSVAKIRTDLQTGKGLHTPLMLQYDHHNDWAYLGEGNHRLAAAEAEGVSEVPVRVVRSPGLDRRKAEGVGAPASHKPIPGISERDQSFGYIPSDIHPSYMVLGRHS